MAQPRTYPHGVTCWIDTEQPDLEAARRFYAGLFGWTLTDAMPPGARRLVPDRHPRRAGRRRDRRRRPAGTAAWNTYVAVDDADATAAAVREAGGTVSSPARGRRPGRPRRHVRWTRPGREFRLWQAGRAARRADARTRPARGTSATCTPPTATPRWRSTRRLFGWRAADLEQGAGTMLQVPGYGDHLAATVDPGIHERQAVGAAGFADVIGGLVVIGAGEPRPLARHFHRGRPRRRAPPRPSGSARRSSARPTTCGPRTRWCATRRAPSSPSASSPRPTATGRTPAWAAAVATAHAVSVTGSGPGSPRCTPGRRSRSCRPVRRRR